MDVDDIEQIKRMVVTPEIEPLEKRVSTLETQMSDANKNWSEASETIKSVTRGQKYEREERIRKEKVDGKVHEDLYGKYNDQQTQIAGLDKGVAVEATKGKMILITALKMGGVGLGLFGAILSALAFAHKMGWMNGGSGG